MKEKTDKLITLAGLGVALLCTILAIMFAMNNGGVKELSAVKANGLFDITYWILVCFVVVSIAAIIYFLVMKLAKRFKEEPGYLKRFLILVGIVVVVLIVSFLLSKGNDVTPALMESSSRISLIAAVNSFCTWRYMS